MMYEFVLEKWLIQERQIDNIDDFEINLIGHRRRHIFGRLMEICDWRVTGKESFDPCHIYGGLDSLCGVFCSTTGIKSHRGHSREWDANKIMWLTVEPLQPKSPWCEALTETPHALQVCPCRPCFHPLDARWKAPGISSSPQFANSIYLLSDSFPMYTTQWFVTT